MSSFAPITITRAGNRLLIDAPFAAKNLVKQIPGRRWDPTKKLWTIPSDLEEEARLILSGWWRGIANEDVRSMDTPEPSCRVCGQRIIPVDGITVHPTCEESMA